MVSVELVIRKDGTRAWKARWRERGQPRARTFTLKRDADAWDREVARRRQLGPLAMEQLTARGGPTLNEWVERRWAPEHAAMLAQATRDRYAEVYNLHIAPWLGDQPLGHFSAPLLSGWQAAVIKAGVRPGTIRKARTLLSSVLRHAAENGAIMANPLSLVRAPRSALPDAVQPLSPVAVERIRGAMLNPAPREVAASSRGQRTRRRYELPAPGTSRTRQRDALIVSFLAYAGLRPGELRALPLGAVRENTILVQRGANPDGSSKATKNRQHRTVRLLAALAQDIREYKLAVGRPPENRLILLDDDGKPWDKNAWQMWRADRWAPACRAVGLDPVPRPYDLRHSFASLLLAEGRQPLYVARQLGHSVAVLLSTYAHLIDEYEDAERIDADAEIAKARRQVGVQMVSVEAE
jgi:integrase